MLQHARSLGDHLLVAIDSDRRVQELKGADRPFFNQEDRRATLQALRSVDWVWIFDSDQDLVDIIGTYAPDIMVKGSDYRGQPIIGEHLVGRIEFFERIDEYSSTKAIQHITNR